MSRKNLKTNFFLNVIISRRNIMRRNITSLVKFTVLCALMVLLTIFLYKTLFYSQRIHDDDDYKMRRRPIANAQEQPFHPRQGAFFMGNNRNAKQIKIDWHDYKYIEAEKQRNGIGEHGVPAFVPSDEETERKRLFDLNGFNGLLSDKISINRSVKDIRHKE